MTTPAARGGSRWREVLAVGLLLVTIALAVAVWAESRRPDQVDLIVERVMVRIGVGDAPAGVADPSTPVSPTCRPVTVVDDYGFEVPITECDPPSS